MSVKVAAIESMTLIPTEGGQFRVWYKEDETKRIRAEYKNTHDMLTEFVRSKMHLTPLGIIEGILEFDGTSAVEYINGFGDGVVVYKEWP